jgi:hypothetical protein
LFGYCKISSSSKFKKKIVTGFYSPIDRQNCRFRQINRNHRGTRARKSKTIVFSRQNVKIQIQISFLFPFSLPPRQLFNGVRKSGKKDGERLR